MEEGHRETRVVAHWGGTLGTGMGTGLEEGTSGRVATLEVAAWEEIPSEGTVERGQTGEAPEGSVLAFRRS